MATLNVSESNEWEEIETISLQNENDTFEANAEIDETSFVEPNDRLEENSTILSPPRLATPRSGMQSRKGSGSKVSSPLDEISSLGLKNRDSRRPSTEGSIDGRSITPHSDTRSYRERLKDRINTVKERAGISVLSTHRSSKQYQNAKTSAVERITDLLMKEEADVRQALERHNKFKEMKKQEIKPIEKKDDVIENESNEDPDIPYQTSFDFFTKIWKPTEESTSPESKLNSPQKDNENIPHPANNETDDTTKLLAADYLGLEDTIVEPVEYKAAAFVDKKALQKKGQEILYSPGSKFVPIEQRIGADTETRDLKSEGIFVPTFPHIDDKTMRKICRRLISEKNTNWFGEDGELIRSPFPLEPIAYHPFNYEEREDELNFLRYEPALLFGQEEAETYSTYINASECYVLELKIINVLFSHHPLFSREHVLANKLSQLFEKYRHRLNVNVSKRLSSKLKALRAARDNLKQILESEENAEMAVVHQERFHRYKTEIRETRRQRMLEGRTDNALLMNLLSTWKDLKRIRSTQGYTSTDVKLQILKSDEAISTEEWQNEIKRQVNEIVDEIGENQKHQNGQQENEDTSIDEQTIKRVREQVIEEMSESLPAPGEPIFVLALAEQDITADADLTNPMEIQRRSLMSRSRVWFRIFYNGHEVCKSTPQPLERQFSCVFNQKFSIRLQEWPESLSIQIFSDGIPSKGIFSEQPLAEIFIPLPARGVTLDNVPAEMYEFSSTEEVGSGVRHSGVGSGIPFKLFTDSETSSFFYTSASLMCQTGWGTSNEQVLSPPEYFFSKLHSRRHNTENDVKIQSDISKLKEWFQSAQLDPNDPSNVALFDLLKKADTNLNESKESFDVESALKICEFCSEEELTSNSRLKLLILRDRGEMEFKNAKAVPLRDWEIPQDIFKEYDKRISNPELPFDTIGLGQLEIHRAWGHHSLTMLYDRILKQCKLSQQLRSTQDVIQEEKVPNINTLGLTFMEFLQPTRPLRPRRREQKKIPVKGLTGQEIKVIVNVVRAFEVPFRKVGDTLSEDSIKYVPVRPFVEITFKGQTRRTVTADGPNPTWNQDLNFLLMGPNDGGFQISNKHSFGDNLHIHLFDEILVDILQDERMRDTTIHQRVERNWLGSLRIPFSTLYFNHQIEGTFQLYSPPFLFGYDRQPSLGSSDHSHLRNSTFLTLFIIVQPPLSPPDPIMEHLECSEPLRLEQHLELWSKEVSKQFPHRCVKTLVTDVGGKSVCVTRFFRSINPPTVYEGETTSAEMIARYVSLIPVSTSGTLLFGHFNVWLTCDQTIRLLLGEREDHAILLCCFLMKLGLKAWLLFGTGIPHGHSAYVLTRDDTSLATPTYTIWDPVTGLSYSSMDSFSPLHKVHCLINDENIWVNIQTEELVRRTNFDVTQRSNWWPAFGRNVSAPSTSVQPDDIEYAITSLADVQLLQDKIEKYLRDSIMKWRPTSRTIWNRYCIATLRKLLPIMEREACGLKQPSNSDHLNELQHIFGSHKMCGFPISQPFTNIKAIIEAVRSTGVHINECPDVEFALAVYVHPYPNDVLSVWVYAVSMVAQR